MYTGGENYTPQAANIVRYAGVVAPIVLILYGVFVQLEFLTPVKEYRPEVFFIFTALMLAVGLFQFSSKSRSAIESALKLVSFHLLAGGFLLFVTGVMTPLAAAWILLMLAANLYFDQRGVWASLALFVVVVVLDLLVINENSIQTVAGDLVILSLMLICGLAVITMNQVIGVDRSELTRSRAQEALQRDRIMTLVNNLADAILSTDRFGIIRVYNAASLNLLDTNDSLNGRHIDEVLRLSDDKGNKIQISDALTQAKSVVVRDDLRYFFDDDESIRLEITFSPIKSSDSRSHNIGHDGYIIIMRDVTKSKSLEEERDEFISVVSHELRTPITIAEGTISNVQLMLSHPDATTDMLKDNIDTAHEQVVFLAKMVNDLSTLSRAERGVADNTEIIDITELISAMHSQYEPEARAKNLMFDVDTSPKLGSVIASRLYLEELLQNFITNAIKYTNEGSITLSAKQARGYVHFSVKDSGIGISKADQKKIFDKFYRSEDYRTRETGGTGLGLYVATKLARKLHTKIELTSRLNHGSTFGFTLSVIDETKK